MSKRQHGCSSSKPHRQRTSLGNTLSRGSKAPESQGPTMASLGHPGSASQDDDSDDMDFSVPRKSRLSAPQLQAQLSRLTDRTCLRRLKDTLLSKGCLAASHKNRGLVSCSRLPQVAFDRKLAHYRNEVGELRQQNIHYRPLVWTADGRPHPAVTRTLQHAADIASSRNGVGEVPSSQVEARNSNRSPAEEGSHGPRSSPEPLREGGVALRRHH